MEDDMKLGRITELCFFLTKYQCAMNYTIFLRGDLILWFQLWLVTILNIMNNYKCFSIRISNKNTTLSHTHIIYRVSFHKYSIFHCVTFLNIFELNYPILLQFEQVFDEPKSLAVPKENTPKVWRPRMPQLRSSLTIQRI